MRWVACSDCNLPSSKGSTPRRQEETMTPLAEQKKALLAAFGAAIAAGSAVVTQGADIASFETTIAALATAAVAYLFAFWTKNE